MEILNNIWMALSTPNELNTQIITLPFTAIEAYIGMFLFLNILNITTTKKNKILYIAFSTLIPTINFFIPTPLNVFISYILSFMCICLLFKTSCFQTLICLFSPMAIFALITTLILNPYLTILNITTEELSAIAIYNIGYLLCLYIISFILISILKIKKVRINLLENIDTRNKNIILTNFIL